MTTQEKIALLEDMLELDEGTLNEATQLDDIDEWDSMAALSLIVLLEDKFDKRITGETIRGFQTVQDILDYMG